MVDCYQVWFWYDQLGRMTEGREVSVCQKTIWNWQRQMILYRMTRMSNCTVISGNHMTLMATFLIAYPDAVADKIAAFLFNRTGHLYCNQSIYRWMKELWITKKKASIDAYQHLSERVQFCVWAFWNCLPGLGIVGIPCRKFIYDDKFSISLEKANRKFSWAPTCYQIRKDGHYCTHPRQSCMLPPVWERTPMHPCLPMKKRAWQLMNHNWKRGSREQNGEVLFNSPTKWHWPQWHFPHPTTLIEVGTIFGSLTKFGSKKWSYMDTIQSSTYKRVLLIFYTTPTWKSHNRVAAVSLPSCCRAV